MVGARSTGTDAHIFPWFLNSPFSQPALILRYCAKTRVLLQFLFTGFATIELKDRIEVPPQQNVEVQEAFCFRSEPFRSLKRPSRTVFISGMPPI